MGGDFFSKNGKFTERFAAHRYFYTSKQAEVAQLVEHQLPKLRAVGSNPIFRSKKKQGLTK